MAVAAHWPGAYYPFHHPCSETGLGWKTDFASYVSTLHTIVHNHNLTHLVQWRSSHNINWTWWHILLAPFMTNQRTIYTHSILANMQCLTHQYLHSPWQNRACFLIICKQALHTTAAIKDFRSRFIFSSALLQKLTFRKWGFYKSMKICNLNFSGEAFARSRK
jgi:hypothetical protein